MNASTKVKAGTDKSFFRLFHANKLALVTLSILSIVFFLENFDRYLLSVAIIPYVNYNSYDYALLSGTLFILFYGLGGVLIVLYEEGRRTALFDSEELTPLERTSRLATHMFSRETTRRRTLCLTGACLVFSVFFGLTALTSSFWQLALIRVGMGITQSIVTPFSAGLIAVLFEPELRGSAFGVYNIGVYVAFSLSFSLGIQ